MTWTKDKGKNQRRLGEEEELICSGKKQEGTTGISVPKDMSLGAIRGTWQKQLTLHLAFPKNQVALGINPIFRETAFPSGN